MLFVTSILPTEKASATKSREPLSDDRRTDGSIEPNQTAANPAAVKSPAKTRARAAAQHQRSFGSLFVRFILPGVAILLLIFAVKHVIDTRKVDVSIAPPIQPPST